MSHLRLEKEMGCIPNDVLFLIRTEDHGLETAVLANARGYNSIFGLLHMGIYQVSDSQYIKAVQTLEPRLMSRWLKYCLLWILNIWKF